MNDVIRTSKERLWSGCKQNDTGYHRPNSEGVCSDCDATRADKALLDVASTLRLMVSSGIPIKDSDLLELARSCELDAKANAHETCDQRGPYCPDTQQPCERMCQSLCNRRTGEATEHRPDNIDCAICKAELPLSMIEMGGRLCPTCVGMPAQKASEGK